MTREDCELAAQICASRAGLLVDPDKTYFLESRLAPVARREGFNSIDDMMGDLKLKRDDRLAWAIVEALAAGETAFYRDRKPFQQFETEILPTLARLRGLEPIRIWSAACGSGQEIYSLAMSVADLRADLPETKVELFASDLSERALEKAQSGLYTQFEVQRGLPIRKLVAHFEKSEEMWVLSPRIRQMVRWRRVNLIADLNTNGRFDVIFCRYVLSGMTPQMRPRLLENLARALTPDGFLVLGEGESITGVSEAFQPVAGRPGLFAHNPAHRAAA
ncbi:MAG TPA: protein-glutamate O-methyltransferase CheR [Phenylobacterium sp.]|nr:protein-glutamate O-methyltransferase CheR [Phenylobacterium sp.]